jgi:hypothetical protein
MAAADRLKLSAPRAADELLRGGRPSTRRECDDDHERGKRH